MRPASMSAAEIVRTGDGLARRIRGGWAGGAPSPPRSQRAHRRIPSGAIRRSGAVQQDRGRSTAPGPGLRRPAPRVGLSGPPGAASERGHARTRPELVLPGCRAAGSLGRGLRRGGAGIAIEVLDSPRPALRGARDRAPILYQIAASFLLSQLLSINGRTRDPGGAHGLAGAGALELPPTPATALMLERGELVLQVMARRELLVRAADAEPAPIASEFLDSLRPAEPRQACVGARR